MNGDYSEKMGEKRRRTGGGGWRGSASARTHRMEEEEALSRYVREVAQAHRNPNE